MCGRYVLFSDPEMAEIREIIEEAQLQAEIKTGEIFPTDTAPILIQESDRLVPRAVNGVSVFGVKESSSTPVLKRRWKNQCFEDL